MAVINCPACNKKISDKAKTCSHCGIDLVNLDSEKLKAIESINKARRAARVTNLSFIALLLFCGGFLTLYWQNFQPGSWQYLATIITSAAGFCLYILTRAWNIVLKKKRK
ncbi:zinc-ribbon domain-containing protein [Thalassotalea agarivorans]|uniref:Zinc-ribbon domain-containing protein n=1 Tax=Thalassotalea agarivorans TaxID=349064 RepID=A0A1I0D8F8_THASX|nr:zinc-ribbon domain-containing protein [Thalassotalea agarivorans]SET28537.1 zinc-ribbon domain-containing protein [Thalassotalea agarivorans]